MSLIKQINVPRLNQIHKTYIVYIRPTKILAKLFGCQFAFFLRLLVLLEPYPKVK